MSVEKYVEGLSAQQGERLHNLLWKTVWITGGYTPEESARLTDAIARSVAGVKPRKVNNNAGLHLVKRWPESLATLYACEEL
jgi:hypothetical protein